MENIEDKQPPSESKYICHSMDKPPNFTFYIGATCQCQMKNISVCKYVPEQIKTLPTPGKIHGCKARKSSSSILY